MEAYKGFNKDLTCRGYQYTEGETYKHEGEVVRCAGSGFHSCEYPLDAFSYYEPSKSVYHLVEIAGDIDREDGGDTKIASAEITVKAELKLPDLIQRSIDWIMSKVDESNGSHNDEDRSHAGNTGDYSAASNTGYQSAASNTGNRSAASNTGNRSAASNTGDYSAASNTGYQSAASNTGYQSAASNTGYQSAASNTGYQSAASNTGNRSAASNTGDYSAASNTGYQSAASNTGYQSAASNTGDYSAAEVSGKNSVAVVTGYESKARACLGSAIVIVYRNDEGELIHIKSAIIDGEELKENVWYTLNSDGEFTEVDS